MASETHKAELVDAVVEVAVLGADECAIIVAGASIGDRGAAMSGGGRRCNQEH